MRKNYNFGFILLGILICSIGVLNVTAINDNDGDGIDDDFEEQSKRDIKIQILSDGFQVESFSRHDDLKNELCINVRYDSEGFQIHLGYESKYDNITAPHFDIQLTVLFQKLIEFVDLNGDGIYTPSIDSTIQEVALTSFQPVEYSNASISPDTTLHYFLVKSADDSFIVHMYFAEEFEIVNGTLLSPLQTKIDVEINDFNYLSGSSQLALYISLKSEGDYKAIHETEDEKEGYSSNEDGVVTTKSNYLGYFTWKENATVDGVSKRIHSSSIAVDEDDPNEQKIYLNYPRGTYIYHDPKIGIAIIPISILPLIIILSIIFGSISISIVYSVYHYRDKIFTTKFSKFSKNQKNQKEIDKIQHHYEVELLKGTSDLKNLNNTVISEDFLDIVDSFKWEKNERQEFIKEMLSLTPEERKSILMEMISKSNDDFD
ncbi:MAG: hypothetical protein ACFFDF_00095 [Candidatus Odinarchaeota archaeon]